MIQEKIAEQLAKINPEVESSVVETIVERSGR